MSWLLLHGALGSADQFDHYLDLLPLAQAYTFPHHGERADGAPFTIDQLAYEVRPALDEEMNVLGHSMGGYVALWLAARYGQRFKQIVCWGTKLDWTPEFYQKQLQYLKPQFFLERRPAFAQSLESQHGKDWPKLVSQTLRMMEELAGGGQLSAQDFAEITTPVTFLVGEGDRMVSHEEALRYVELMPNARAILCPDMGHDLPSAEDMEALMARHKL